MYPRAEAYIISVKQSTYCQFRVVIRAHTERGGILLVERGRWQKRKGRRDGLLSKREQMNTNKKEGRSIKKLEVSFICENVFKDVVRLCRRCTGLHTETSL